MRTGKRKYTGKCPYGMIFVRANVRNPDWKAKAAIWDHTVLHALPRPQPDMPVLDFTTPKGW